MKSSISAFTQLLDAPSGKYVTDEVAVNVSDLRPTKPRSKAKAQYIYHGGPVHSKTGIIVSDGWNLLQHKHLAHVPAGSMINSAWPADAAFLGKDRALLGSGLIDTFDENIVSKLEREVRYLRETTEKLFGRVESRLTALESSTISESLTGPQLRDLQATSDDGLKQLESAEPERIADVLDMAADQEIGSPALLDFTRDALAHRDAIVRGAAARAFAVLAPSEAEKVLPELLIAEKNRATAQVLRSAIRSISV